MVQTPSVIDFSCLNVLLVSDAILKLSLSGKKSLKVKEAKYEEYNRDLADQMKTKTYGVTAGGYYATEKF